MKTTFFNIALLAILYGFSQATTPDAIILEGRVVAETTGRPVANAHAYVLDGEEEALTNANGEFRIKSWQKAPFRLTVEKQDSFHKASVFIANPSVKQVIRLRPKYN